MLISAKFCKQTLNVGRMACVRLKSTAASSQVTAASAEAADAEMATDLLQFPFSFARVGNFAQEAPQLGNQYTQDTLVRAFLKRYVPAEVFHYLLAESMFAGFSGSVMPLTLV
jgi:hypothetical protein